MELIDFAKPEDWKEKNNMMQQNCSYLSTNKLSEILADKRLKPTKYSGASQKYINIWCGDHMYRTNGQFLTDLEEKYGNISFDEALSKWEDEK